ncbi:MAG: hypothetical protein GY807_13830 [Gammaproteobacteria bacterium]|nr:hypothetical protein [Gammaproteobacteria bacterium]
MMILIESIKVREVPGEHCNIPRLPGNGMRAWMGAAPPDSITKEAETETVRGRRYIRPDGTEIVIGMTEQAQDVIGIQYEAWENLQGMCDANRAESDRLVRVISKLQERFEAAECATVWDRIRWVFQGVAL